MGKEQMIALFSYRLKNPSLIFPKNVMTPGGIEL